MKKILVIVSALMFVAACAAPPTNQSTPVATSNTAATPAAAVMTEADAIAKEKSIWDTIQRKDYAGFGDLLAEDSIEVTGEAVYDKAGSIASVKEFEPSDLAFSDWKFISIDQDAYAITYTVNMKGKYKGKDFPAMTGRCSSAWVSRDGKWLAMYHQESEVQPPMPPAKTAAKPNSALKASPSPAAAPVVAATGPDPIANEKIVWDLFKAKNYDGFAAVLAADFLEVEPDRVHDKAEAVKGVSGFDASKAVLSDWQAVKLDEDAALVTYVVKLPMPGMPATGERHSTIWVNRDGKWLGLLHHGGTTVMKPGAMAAASPSPAAKSSASPATATTSPAAKPSPMMKTSPAMKATPKKPA